MRIRPRGKPVPVKWHLPITHEWHRKFRFRERLQILFGYNFVVTIGIAVRHNPGPTSPIIIGEVSNCPNASERVRQIVQNLESYAQP